MGEQRRLERARIKFVISWSWRFRWDMVVGMTLPRVMVESSCVCFAEGQSVVNLCSEL